MSLRIPNKAYVHIIDWEKDVSYYLEDIASAGFTELEAADSMSMDFSENNSLSYLFTGYMEDPVVNAGLMIFYGVLMDIVRKRSYKPEGLLRGDMINVNFLGETPQDGWFFWDGDKIIQGRKIRHNIYNIPEEFKIFEEFPPNYWEKYPFDKIGGEIVKLNKSLFYRPEYKASLREYNVYIIWFQGYKYIVCMNKEFSERVLDSNDDEIFNVYNTYIPDEVVDFLKSKGMDTEMIYQNTIACNEIDQDELSNLLEDMDL